MKKIFFGAALLLLAGCSSGNTNTTSATSSTTNTSVAQASSSAVASTSETTQQTSSTKASTGSTTDSQFTVTLDEVVKVFQDKYPDTVLTQVSLDSSFGKYFYKIEGSDAKQEYELEVDANTKEILKDKQESQDPDDWAEAQQDALDLKGIITIEKAGELAEQAAGDGHATDWELSKDLDIMYWEVKVEGQKEIEVKLDAHSGKVLHQEVD